MKQNRNEYACEWRRKRRRDYPELVKTLQKFSTKKRSKKKTIYVRNIRNGLRIKILEYLSNTCIGCGESNPSFLEIDHVYNDGKIEREIFTGGSIPYYEHILGTINTGRYQLLCANCNWLKHLMIIKSKSNIKWSYHKYKDRVFDHYGRRCNCCNETNTDLLCIDHIHGGGTKITTQVWKESKRSVPKWIIDNNYPDSLQILCRNCNRSKGIGQHCSHMYVPVVITQSKELMVIS